MHPSSDIQSDKIGTETNIWQYCVILPGASIGDNCNICSHCLIENDVVIGDNVTVKSGVQIWDGITVEDNVFIGPNVTFTNDSYPRSKEHLVTHPKTLIRSGASIGANATIVCGVTLGEYSFIGSGAIVTKDVPNHALVIGNPGKIVGWVDKKGHQLKFDENGMSACEKYRLEKNKLIEL